MSNLGSSNHSCFHVMRGASVLAVAFACLLPLEVAHAASVWGTPYKVANINTSGYLTGGATFSNDGLTMLFHSTRPGGAGGTDIWMSTRSSTSAAWGAPVDVAALNSGAEDRGASLSGDGLTVYFGSTRAGGHGSYDIWKSTRASVSDTWSAPVDLGLRVNSSDLESGPEISADGQRLFFDAYRSDSLGGVDIYVARHSTPGGPWDLISNLGPNVNGPDAQGGSSVSSDRLTMYYHGSVGGDYQLFVSHLTPGSGWSPGQLLGPQINTGANQFGPEISPDGKTLYYAQEAVRGDPSTREIWAVSAVPEPATYALFGVGLVALWGTSRRRS